MACLLYRYTCIRHVLEYESNDAFEGHGALIHIEPEAWHIAPSVAHFNFPSKDWSVWGDYVFHGLSSPYGMTRSIASKYRSSIAIALYLNFE